jgi:hypothetical protein
MEFIISFGLLFVVEGGALGIAMLLTGVRASIPGVLIIVAGSTAVYTLVPFGLSFIGLTPGIALLVGWVSSMALFVALLKRFSDVDGCTSIILLVVLTGFLKILLSFTGVSMRTPAPEDTEYEEDEEAILRPAAPADLEPSVVALGRIATPPDSRYHAS